MIFNLKTESNYIKTFLIYSTIFSSHAWVAHGPWWRHKSQQKHNPQTPIPKQLKILHVVNH